MRILSHADTKASVHIPASPIARFLFVDTKMSWLWLIVRLYVGYEWLAAGWAKVFGRSLSLDATFGQAVGGKTWVFNDQAGQGLTKFLAGALTKSLGTHPDVQGWYALFLRSTVLPHIALFAHLIAFGELCVGLGLILGCFTGVAAFFGLFMNLNYMLAGAVSINPVIGVLAALLVLAWRVAGYYGADRYLLPLLGTPWWSGRWKAKKFADVDRPLVGPGSGVR